MKRIALAGALALAPAVAAAETWTVLEGPNGKTHGVWTVTIVGATINGSADMKTGRGANVTYKVAGNIRGGDYVIQRVSPSDGIACVYVGKSAGPKAINGSAKCGDKTATWKVVRAR